jgi:hypothetical protein
MNQLAPSLILVTYRKLEQIRPERVGICSRLVTAISFSVVFHRILEYKWNYASITIEHPIMRLLQAITLSTYTRPTLARRIVSYVCDVDFPLFVYILLRHR